MPSFWAVISPEAGTNLVVNPIAGTTGNFAKYGASVVSIATTAARFGYTCFAITPAGTSQGSFFALTTATNTTHYASAYVRGTITGSIRATMDSGSNFNTCSVIGGHAGAWVRYGVAIPPAQATGSGWVAFLDTANDGAIAIDGVQVEANTHPTTFICGDNSGLYRWNGLRHASSSIRDAQERSGGDERDLFDFYGITVRPSFSGVGMPPIQNNIQSMALQPGALLQSQKVLPREIVLDFSINAINTAASWVNLHRSRQQLLNLIKPDATRGIQPFTLRYTGTAGAGAAATSPLYAKFTYADGLRFNGVQSGFLEEPSVRCLATDPFWYEDNQEVAALTIQKSISPAANILQKKYGEGWTSPGNGVTTGAGGVFALLVDKNETLYAGGYFYTMNGVSNTTGIAYWDNSAWYALGAGINGVVRTLSLLPDNSIVAGGNFTTAAGGAGTGYVAQWKAGTWTSQGGGLQGASNGVYSSCIGPDGALYVGGDFTTAGGVAGTSRIAKWYQGAWSSLGSGTTSGYVYALVAGKDGAIYAGGDFNAIGGVTGTTGLAKWNGTQWVNIGAIVGSSPFISGLVCAQDGTIYAGGKFYTIGGISANNVAGYSGSSFFALSGGFNGQLSGNNCLSMIGNVLLACASPLATTAGSVPINGLAQWNGAVWSRYDVDYPSGTANSVYQFTRNRAGTIYSGFFTTGTAYGSEVTSVVPNCSEAIFPNIWFLGPTTAGTTAGLVAIENQTSSEKLYFNYNLQGGETIALNLTPNNKTMISDWYGTVFGQPMSGSDVAAFHLLPTTNTIACYISGRATTTSGTAAIMSWTPTHWAVDGAA